MKIQPLVEGHGEVQALPVLFRRLQEVSGVFELDVHKPVRATRPELTRETSLRQLIRRSLTLRECSGLLVLFDGDDDCPKELAPRIQGWGQDEAGNVPCLVVIAHREYEAWLFSVLDPPLWPEDPETVRDAKSMISREYSPTRDQARLTARFDLATAHRRCRSFRRLVRAFGLLAEGAGFPLSDWPPLSWRDSP
jgi:hypothetical protein